MSEALLGSSIGAGIGIPLALGSAAIVYIITRTMLVAADKPGMSPALIPVALLAFTGMLLYASNPELTELAGIASSLGGFMGGYLGKNSVKIEKESAVMAEVEPMPEEEEELHEEDSVTERVYGSQGIPPEEVKVPEHIEKIGVEEEDEKPN